MSIGYNTILKLRRIEEECAKMGFRMAYSKYGTSSMGDMIAILPKDDALPIYTRDVELFTGNLDELAEWIAGAQWMHNYYIMLKVTDEKKIKKKENDIRCDQLVRKLKGQPTEEEEEA